MKKKIIKGVCAALVIATSFTIGAFASGSLQKISAYLNYGVTIKYDGNVQKMYDANGVRVYPITYNGTTYIPVRAVANMFGENVEWDGANNSVLLGNTGTSYDFVENFTPYYASNQYKNYHSTILSGKQLKVGNKTYDHFVCMEAEYLYQNGKEYGTAQVSYDLDGKYSELKFKTTIDENYKQADVTVYVYGDNDAVLAQINVKPDDVAKEYTIPLHRTDKMSVVIRSNTAFNSTRIYFYEMSIK